jgi:multidrug efflux pump subunit AcrB
MRDKLVRLDGVGDVQIFGEREYALRIWLDPGQAGRYRHDRGDVVSALREQNVQVSGGSIGAPPIQATMRPSNIRSRRRGVSRRARLSLRHREVDRGRQC